MTGNSLADRGKGLEDAFFARQDAELRRRLASNDESGGRRAALAQASGITDEAALDALARSGMNATLAAAMAVAPAVMVAWADGRIEPDERTVLLDAAEYAGLDKRSPPYALFAGWLGTQPPADLFDTWSAYMAAVLPTLTAEARRSLRASILTRSHAVAEAAGGFLRLTARTSASEKAVLQDIERVLADKT